VVLRASRQRGNLHGSAELLIDLVIRLFHSEEYYGETSVLKGTAFLTSLHVGPSILYSIANVLHQTKDFLAGLAVWISCESDLRFGLGFLSGRSRSSSGGHNGNVQVEFSWQWSVQSG
jgi:hypothetical protein